MGATASGKTDVAIELSRRFPMDVISVDSALVYRGMDIGTAKPDAETLRDIPHRLIDIREPEQSYSAGDFVRDAREEIASIFAAGRVPLLVGGTMMYFRSLTEGIAELPSADQAIRDAIDADAERLGWPGLHRELTRIDPDAASKINPNDSQRIQRALEVYRASGKPLSEWQQESHREDDGTRFLKVVLQLPDRRLLHQRIEQRLREMLSAGFVDEVRGLVQRPGLTRENPSMRAVGYRQLWGHVVGEYPLAEASDKALAATRQLAKRQLTWLRSEFGTMVFDPLESGTIDAISAMLSAELG